LKVFVLVRLSGNVQLIDPRGLSAAVLAADTLENNM
jgi:hypothetical protein